MEAKYLLHLGTEFNPSRIDTQLTYEKNIGPYSTPLLVGESIIVVAGKEEIGKT